MKITKGQMGYTVMLDECFINFEKHQRCLSGCINLYRAGKYIGSIRHVHAAKFRMAMHQCHRQSKVCDHKDVEPHAYQSEILETQMQGLAMEKIHE